MPTEAGATSIAATVMQKRKFTDECNDVREFQEHCRQIMMKGGHNRIMAWLFTRGMKRLERWKEAEKGAR